jgi:hypothetical protein
VIKCLDQLRRNKSGEDHKRQIHKPGTSKKAVRRLGWKNEKDRAGLSHKFQTFSEKASYIIPVNCYTIQILYNSDDFIRLEIISGKQFSERGGSEAGNSFKLG